MGYLFHHYLCPCFTSTYYVFSILSIYLLMFLVISLVTKYLFLQNLTGGPRGGVHATDVTNASRTQLMSLRSLQWERGLLRFFDIPKQILPKIKSSAEIYGYISSGSLIGVPIAGVRTIPISFF